MEAYSKQFRIEIGSTVLKKHRIYLDTKYWVFMREASIGKASPTKIGIYEKLKDLVTREILICPLSPHIFYELMKIGDKQKRLNMAKVMDELSHQVCFISPIDIVGQELISFFRLYQSKSLGKPLFNPVKYVWTKVPFVLGEVYPTIEGLPVEEMNYIRTSFFDYLSKLTLVEMLTNIKKELPMIDYGNIASRLNIEIDNNQEWNSFHDVFIHEIGGILDVAKDEIEKVAMYLSENDIDGTAEDVQDMEDVGLMPNIIYNLFDQKRINGELPFFHINASLYAFVRYNKGQRYDKNDFIDFSHTAWALPYCDAFLTEKPLHDWIRNNKLMLDKVYKTKVDYKEEEVLDYLNTL